MPAIDRPADRGRRLGDRLRIELGDQLRLARVAAGLSQAEMGRACGLSGAAIGRLERGDLESPGVVELAIAFAVSGLELSVRAYPVGAAYRTRAHAELLARFRTPLPDACGWRIEVPFPVPGDLRAWDAAIRLSGARIGIEAETRPRDGQELLRRMNRKRADGGMDRVILLIADTRSNRLFLRDHADAFAVEFPVPGALAMRRMVRGEDPGGDAVIRF